MAVRERNALPDVCGHSALLRKICSLRAGGRMGWAGALCWQETLITSTTCVGPSSAAGWGRITGYTVPPPLSNVIHWAARCEEARGRSICRRAADDTRRRRSSPNKSDSTRGYGGEAASLQSQPPFLLNHRAERANRVWGKVSVGATLVRVHTPRLALARQCPKSRQKLSPAWPGADLIGGTRSRKAAPTLSQRTGSMVLCNYPLSDHEGVSFSQTCCICVGGSHAPVIARPHRRR